MKRSTLIAETRRRLLNTSVGRPQRETAEMLTDFCKAMKGSGYGDGTRIEVIDSALTGHKKRMIERKQRGLRIYRKGLDESHKRSNMKLRLKGSWF